MIKAIVSMCLIDDSLVVGKAFTYLLAVRTLALDGARTCVDCLPLLTPHRECLTVLDHSSFFFFLIGKLWVSFLCEARRSWREKAVFISTWCLIVLAHFSIGVTFDYSSACHGMSLEELIELMLLLNKKYWGQGVREEQEKWTAPKNPEQSFGYFPLGKGNMANMEVWDSSPGSTLFWAGCALGLELIIAEHVSFLLSQTWAWPCSKFKLWLS